MLADLEVLCRVSENHPNGVTVADGDNWTCYRCGQTFGYPEPVWTPGIENLDPAEFAAYLTRTRERMITARLDRPGQPDDLDELRDRIHQLHTRQHLPATTTDPLHR